MKTILKLLILIYLINLVKSSLNYDQVYTNFTIHSSSCRKFNKFEIDNCNSWCGSEYYGKIIYNSNSKKYEISIYYDKQCSIIMPDASLPEITCPKGRVANESGDEVVCSDLTSIINYKSFTIKQNSSKCENDLYISSCVNICNNNYFKIIKGSGTVNSYNVSIYENTKEMCGGKLILNKNFKCPPNHHEVIINDHYKLVCNGNNSSSVSSGSTLTENSNANSTTFKNHNLNIESCGVILKKSTSLFVTTFILLAVFF